MTQTLIAADPPSVPPSDGPPGQPYISPDDLASIRPLWNQAVQQHLMPVVAEMWSTSVDQVHAEMVDVTGVELPSVSSLAAEQYLSQAANTFESVGDDLWATAQSELLAGFQAGESIPQLTDRLRQSAGLTAKSAVLVARTQVIEASNAGSIATARVSGLEMQKEWMSAEDVRVRPAHVEANGQKVDLNATFTVGGYQADAPGDPSLPPDLRYRCRCTLGYLMPDASVRQAVRDATPEPALPNTSGVPPVEAAPVAAPVEDRAARRAAARARQKVIDQAEPVAAFAAEIDNVAYARQGLPFDEETATIFRQRLRQAEVAGVPADDLSAVEAAVEARDLVRLRGRVKRLTDESELTPIGAAGELLPFDPELMRAVSDDLNLADGEQVQVIRQGFILTVKDEQVRLDPALVVRPDGSLTAASGGSNIDIRLGQGDNQPMATTAAQDPIVLSPPDILMPDIEDGTPWEGVLAPEGVWSGDGRQFAPSALTWAPLPLALKWQPEEDDGHDGAVIVGRIDTISRVGNLIHATGVMDDEGLYGAEALRLMQNRMLRGVSIRGDDTDEEDIELVYPTPGMDMPMVPEPGYAIQVPDQPEPEMPMDIPMPEPMGEPKVIVHKARIRSATLCPEQAFVEAEILLADGDLEAPSLTTTAGPGPTVVTAAAYTITIPEIWPEQWFDEPSEQPPFGALHITPQGRVFGYLGPDMVSHRAFRASGRKVTIPRGVDYSEFQNKPALVAGADGHVYRINAGNITFDCGHPSPYDQRRADAMWAMQHYDNTCSIAARIRVGENRHGTWVAGGLLHGITADAFERMMACALSGDWQGGKLNAALLVPVEGFPVGQTSSIRIRDDAIVASSVPIRFAANPQPVDTRPVLERLARSINRDAKARFAELRLRRR